MSNATKALASAPKGANGTTKNAQTVEKIAPMSVDSDNSIKSDELAKAEKIDEMNKVLAAKEEYYQQLKTLMKKREILCKHIAKLETKVEQPDFEELLKQEETVDNHNDPAEIVLKFSRGYDNQSYEIGNSKLVKEVADFILGRLKSRLTEIEKEIALL